MNDKDFFTRLIYGLIEGKDLPYLAMKLAQSIERPVIITDNIHRILVFQNPSDLSHEINEFFPVPYFRINEEQLMQGDPTVLSQGQLESDNNSITYSYLPLQTAGKCLGYCIVLDACNSSISSDPTPLSEKDKTLIMQAAIALLLVLKNKREYSLGQEQFRDEFIRDVLYNNYDSKSNIYEKADLWHWNLQGPMVILVLECKLEKIRTARDLIPNSFNNQPPISAYINNQLTIILNMKNLKKRKQRTALNKFLSPYISQLEHYETGEIEIGVGSTVSAVTDLHLSYQEAKVALELGKVFNHRPICFFEEMGFLKFIFTQPAMELQDFSQRVLGPIIENDLETGGNLLDTLRSHIECKCQIGECAKALYVHENTLRNRIKKIEQLTGFDLRRVDHMVNVYIALQVLHLGIET
ncbi:MAG: sugar diacid utilization regulator [Gracilibacter sp. BRH_c7a]|nr:MAG: sugar diacid utilization regulator [Gracilibacter sp. BRH_c7a]